MQYNITYTLYIHQIYSVECVFKIKSSLSMNFMPYMGLRLFSLPISLLQIVSMFVIHLIFIGHINYYPLFRSRSWNNGMPCMFCYVLRLLRAVLLWLGRTFKWEFTLTLALHDVSGSQCEDLEENWLHYSNTPLYNQNKTKSRNPCWNFFWITLYMFQHMTHLNEVASYFCWI